VPQRVKDRAEAVRLNAQGWDVERIAPSFQWNVQTVRETLHRGHNDGQGFNHKDFLGSAWQ